jgi:hypothetical protein
MPPLSAMFSLSVLCPSTCKRTDQRTCSSLNLGKDCSSLSQTPYRLVQLGHSVAAVLLHEALRTFLKFGVRASAPPIKRRPELVILPACTQNDVIASLYNCCKCLGLYCTAP